MSSADFHVYDAAPGAFCLIGDLMSNGKSRRSRMTMFDTEDTVIKLWHSANTRSDETANNDSSSRHSSCVCRPSIRLCACCRYLTGSSTRRRIQHHTILIAEE